MGDILVSSKKQTLLNIVEAIENLQLKVNANSLYILDSTSSIINDEGGFYIDTINYQINYIDINGEISATYNLFDSEDYPTDTYIVKKILVSKLENQIEPTLDRSGGSSIQDNQQIYYDEYGVESCRYNLFDDKGVATMSEIFSKELVI